MAVELKPGDRVRVGKLDFMVVIDGMPSDEQMASDAAAAAAAAAEESGTSLEFAVVTPEDAPSEVSNDTSVISLSDAAALQATMEIQAADVPGQGYPAQGQFAQQPWGGPPPQYPYPGGYPQYPGMPYGYGYPYPGVPQPMPPGYGYPMPQQPPQQPEPVAEAQPAKGPELEIRLPDPSTTGAKLPEPKPAASGGGGGKGDHVPTMAKDIINSYLQRKPKSE
ncbi:MAG: hypothetical protein R3B90_20085 [Planctomycetaceae bacterium]